ncbi:hypothetical protein [Polyangium sp. 15x6]|uniref:hypothetical protein n=1 Tax=Polyangium sp. 15x6 TaxID=3042687 RepID=UPI00249B94A8|nr:hypothetical protein [Polyangium sp. 15x6]MDI3290136.1 hypothetical protein [Polyangium sp. 15x6]
MAPKNQHDQQADKDLADRRAWPIYERGLDAISDPDEALAFATYGPSNGEPGSIFYHNLGCYLQDNPMDRPAKYELKAILRFVRRAEAAGHYKSGSGDACEAYMQKVYNL